MRDRLIELISQVQYMGGLEGRLADYLLKNGVIVPPCYIGQEIWYIRNHGRIEIIKGKVSMIQQKADKSWKIRITVNSSVWDFTPNEIDTQYFLTREEAERALERSENGK